jgi:ring-1,2-phenylacetyl-CoA epoxidase subunit PaaC
MTKQNNLAEYCLRLGDSNLILAQRLGEWCGHGPILEEDIALTNICLDLLGQSRALLTYAGEAEGKGRTEDDLAYLREALDYRNVLLVEQPNGDFAQTILKQFFYSAYQYFLYDALKQSKDKMISALAEKSLKEVTYHLRHSSEWVKRLGAGTEESNQRINDALNELWIYTGDMFDMDEVDAALIKEGIAVDLNLIKVMWENKVKEVFTEAELTIPESTFMIRGSRTGKHTEHLGYILAEMQVLHRQHPQATW